MAFARIGALGRGFSHLGALYRKVGTSRASFAPSLIFSDARNSQYFSVVGF
jgi:hypothetical protein